MKKIISFLITLSILSSFTTSFASGFSSYGDGRDITKELTLEKRAVYIEAENAIFLCPAASYVMGNAIFPFKTEKNFSVSFDYKIGGGSSADGISFNFFADKVSTSDGGYIGMDGAQGYAVELDTFKNTWDKSNSHIALISEKSSNHLATEHIENLRDNQWHSARIDVNGNLINVYIDGKCVLSSKQYFNNSSRIAYFSASTGASTDNHYIRNVRYSAETEFNNDITINRHGKAYARFVIKDKRGNTLRGTRLKYMLSGYNSPMYTETDSNGVAIIETPYISGQNVQRRFDVTFPDIATEKDKYSFTVNINDLSYENTWEGKLLAGANVAAGYEGKLKFGPVDSKASLASLTLEGKAAKTMSVTDSYDSGRRNLVIAVSQDADLSGDISAGAFAEGSIGKYKAEIAPVKAGANATYGGGVEVGLNIEDFSPENEEHIAKIAYFLLDAAMPSYGVNALLKLLSYNLLGVPYNEMKGSVNVRLGAGASLGSLKFKSEYSGKEVMSANLVGANADVFYGYSYGNDKDNNDIYNAVATTDCGMSILTFTPQDDVNDLSNGIDTYGFSKSISEIELSSKSSEDTTDELALKMVEKSNTGDVLWYEETQNHYKEYTFTDGAARAAAKRNSRVESFTQGSFGLFCVPELKDAARDILTSEYEADYTRNTSISKGVSANIGIGVQVLVGGGVDLGFSAIESIDYETENGKAVGGQSYILSKSNPESYINGRRHTLEEIFMAPVDFLNREIGKQVVTEKSTADKCVRNNKAAVSGKTRRNVGLTGITKRLDINTFSILTVSEDNISASKTVGDPYVVAFYDDSDSYIEETTDEDIVLTLSFDESDLAAAGTENTQEALNALKIYRWDNDTGAYTYIGGELDFVSSTVSANIKKSGQYILAIDAASPEITHFEAGTGSTPKISAIIRDMSGVDSAELIIDGETVVDKNNFKTFYNRANSLLSYTPSVPLSEGEHSIYLTATDSAGNKTQEPLSLTITTKSNTAILKSVNVPEFVTDGCLVVSATTNSPTETVIADIHYNDAIHSYNMTKANGVWTAEIDDVPANTEISVTVYAYDLYKNVTKSDTFNTISFGATSETVDIGIFDISDNKLHAAVLNCGEEIDGKIFAAAYDEHGILRQIKSSDFTFGNGYTKFDVDIDSSYSEYRLYFWGDDITPLSCSSRRKIYNNK